MFSRVYNNNHEIKEEDSIIDTEVDFVVLKASPKERRDIKDMEFVVRIQKEREIEKKLIIDNNIIKKQKKRIDDIVDMPVQKKYNVTPSKLQNNEALEKKISGILKPLGSSERALEAQNTINIEFGHLQNLLEERLNFQQKQNVRDL